MDLDYGSKEASKFVTNVGLITSNGKHGNNIMAVEWTHHISYSPGLIAIHISEDCATYENIKESKEFGINICSTGQGVMSSVSGNYSGKSFDKIKALEELGFSFYKAKKINALMVENASMNAECKLVKEIELGDHLMLVGEAIETKTTESIPLALHNGRYWVLDKTLPKRTDEERTKIRNTVEKHRK